MSAAMAMNLLEDWCRGMEADIHRSLLVTGIPEDCGQAEIEETLNGVLSPLGTYRVLNKIFLREENAKAALVEVSEGVNLSSIPREFPGRGGVWRVACRDPTQDAEFLKNLNEFLDTEGRTWEDVVRLLQLNHPPRPQNQPAESWAGALGVLLGAVVQIVVYMDAEMRNREEARALENAELEEEAAWLPAGRKKVKKERGLVAADLTSVLKMEHPGHWNGRDGQSDSPKPLGRRAGAKSRSRRKRNRRANKQEPVSWKESGDGQLSSSAYLSGHQMRDPENMEVSESIKSSKKPCIKQEASTSKKALAKNVWKVPRDPPRRPLMQTKTPAGGEEWEQDGGLERPPKKKVLSWASAKSSAFLRRKKKVSLGPVSYVLVDSEGTTRKKSRIAKRGLASRKPGANHRAPQGQQPTEVLASTSRGLKAKPRGLPCTSKGSRKL
ncbi:paraneoplastic antigen-like protein 8A [Perognathus longimembris pacificus]|uniref:paraneoplastic antigen-like protein 8A n=1 Tax=Perognathus longimembris pacificus TaxID=214514 RepID=UPI002019D266|nr:paraneoplastic antigen-like protein 8A [Perognathus longimembris pacificus]